MTVLFIITIILIVLLIRSNNVFGIHLLSYFLGVFILQICEEFQYRGVDLGQGGRVLVSMSYIANFSVLYLSSLLYLLSKRNGGVYYFAAPCIVYILIICSFMFEEFYLWGGLFLAFFPAHIYSYYKLQKLGKL
ncbi:hypothetical protein [Chryseobacterium lactis]|uniref:hypothetical protein n=1 Tax=Chryseobacterium lactis TaxID=1241981 RepID=UPI00162815E7|nr:hypothetical protein [Chryseobacterium lactis]